MSRDDPITDLDIWRAFGHLGYGPEEQLTELEHKYGKIRLALDPGNQKASLRHARLYDRAVALIGENGYPIETRDERRNSYFIEEFLGEGVHEPYTVICEGNVIVKRYEDSKLALKPAQLERRLFEQLRQAAYVYDPKAAFMPFFPRVLSDDDPMTLRYEFEDGWVPFSRLLAKFPQGVPSEHTCWIFNRLLSLGGFLTQVARIAGSSAYVSFPTNLENFWNMFWIHPGEHMLRIMHPLYMRNLPGVFQERARLDAHEICVVNDIRHVIKLLLGECRDLRAKAWYKELDIYQPKIERAIHQAYLDFRENEIEERVFGPKKFIPLEL